MNQLRKAESSIKLSKKKDISQIQRQNKNPIIKEIRFWLVSDN